jgi:Protein of unknown function (DUF3616)
MAESEPRASEGKEGADPQLALEREKFEVDTDLRKRELELKLLEARRSRWLNPLVLAVVGATLATIGNGVVTWMGGSYQRELDDTRARTAQTAQNENNKQQLALESFKAESLRILEVTKTSNPDLAAENLKFLLHSGLIANEQTAKKLREYLDVRPAGKGVALPVGTAQNPAPAAVSGSFDFERSATRLSVSGIACPPASPSPRRRCIVLFDEGSEARYVVVEGGEKKVTLEPDRIAFFRDSIELDAEAAARDGNTVYVTGSHSPKRANCDPNPDSRHVIKFEVDGTTGKTSLDAAGTPISMHDDNGALWKLLTNDPVLKSFAGDGKCLGKPDHAANIEGLAAKDGMLYFGFREPALNRQTFILRIRADQLFSGDITSTSLFTMEVGRGRGIRDLLAVPEGLLILTGPEDIDQKTLLDWQRKGVEQQLPALSAYLGHSDGNHSGSSVAFWDPNGSPDSLVKPRTLKDLDLSSIVPDSCTGRMDGPPRPEALTMIEDGKDRLLLFLSDGVCDGKPMFLPIGK